MNYDSIKRNIEIFKRNNNFEEKDFIKILNDLDDLYKIKNNSYFQLTSNEYILNEKENFKKFLIGSLLQNANKEAKLQNFDLALKYIRKLDILKPPEKENKEIKKIKQFCEINLNWNKGENLMN